MKLEVRRNAEATAGLAAGEIVELTDAATRATFYADGLTPDQVSANERIAAISADSVFQAALARHQHLVAAFDRTGIAGFVIATRHAPDDLELDWLMVHPRLHGSGAASLLMTEGLDWLGLDRPSWLTVIRHNQRAIRFYRKFGFEIDQQTELNRTVPSWVMRRRPDNRIG